jgi:Dephospho-CoA kinase
MRDVDEYVHSLQSYCIFKQFGAQVVCCDELAHRALKKNTHTYYRIVKTFGREILDLRIVCR